MSNFQSASLYKDVAGLDEELLDTVVPNGETWEIVRFVGAASYLDDTVTCLVFDPGGADEILACTHGDTNMEPFIQVVGDGVKVLRILLSNDTNAARVMGCRWEAKVL